MIFDPLSVLHLRPVTLTTSIKMGPKVSSGDPTPMPKSDINYTVINRMSRARISHTCDMHVLLLFIAELSTLISHIEFLY